MIKKPKICLIGEVIIDVTLTSSTEENKIRLGGIIHSARALWAMNIEYDVLFIAPTYMPEQIKDYVINHGASSAIQIGTVTKSPNVILIKDPIEAGDQGYELLLRDEYQAQLDIDRIEKYLKENSPSDIIIFTGGYELINILSICKKYNHKIHIDIANGISSITPLEIPKLKFDTIFLSTSSQLFQNTFNKSVNRMRDSILGKLCKHLIFKENRGGDRYYCESHPNKPIYIGAQLKTIVHSIGVGDCFDVVFISSCYNNSISIGLAYASWIAAEYAATTYPDDFKRECQRILQIKPEKLIKIRGISLPWEKRKDIHIYIAAPDFEFINPYEIERLANCLKYHNFVPHLPIRENGRIQTDASQIQKKELFIKDMELLADCQIIIAILLGDDPGTLIEIGIAAGLQKPVIVYDPYSRAENLILTELPKLISNKIDDVISEVFIMASKVVNK